MQVISSSGGRERREAGGAWECKVNQSVEPMFEINLPSWPIYMMYLPACQARCPSRWQECGTRPLRNRLHQWVCPRPSKCGTRRGQCWWWSGRCAACGTGPRTQSRRARCCPSRRGGGGRSRTWPRRLIQGKVLRLKRRSSYQPKIFKVPSFHRNSESSNKQRWMWLTKSTGWRHLVVLKDILLANIFKGELEE